MPFAAVRSDRPACFALTFWLSENLGPILKVTVGALLDRLHFAEAHATSERHRRQTRRHAARKKAPGAGTSRASCRFRFESNGTKVLVSPVGVGTLASSVEAMTAGNILVGGVIGLGVDPASGAINKYEPGVEIL
jgi:hypothetical protein